MWTLRSERGDRLILLCRFTSIARECLNTIMEVYKKCMAFSKESGTFIILSGGNHHTTLNVMADILWTKHGPPKNRDQPRVPKWIYEPFEIVKIFGPTQIGGEGATLFLEDAITIGRSAAVSEGGMSRNTMRSATVEGGSSAVKADDRARSVPSPSPSWVRDSDGDNANADIIKQLHFKTSTQALRESKEIEATVEQQQLGIDQHQTSSGVAPCAAHAGTRCAPLPQINRKATWQRVRRPIQILVPGNTFTFWN